MNQRYTVFDPTAVLVDDEMVELFLTEAIRSEHMAHIRSAFELAAISKGAKALAEREGLSLDTVRAILTVDPLANVGAAIAALRALGIQVSSADRS